MFEINETDGIALTDNKFIGSSSQKYNPKIDPRTPYRNLYLAVVDNAFDQLFDPIGFEIKATTSDISRLKSYAVPKFLNLHWGFKVFNCMDYKIAHNWFLCGDNGDAFDFITCCDILDLDKDKIINRVNFIHEARKNAIKSIIDDKDSLKIKLRMNHKVIPELRAKYKSNPTKDSYSLLESGKIMISSKIAAAYEGRYGVRPIPKNDNQD